MLTIRHVDAGAARLAVHCRGHGPLCLLVHAYPLDHRMWLDLLASPLAQRRTLAAVDLRGHGASPWAGDAVHSMELLAQDLAAVIDALGAPADVVAVSMGGYAALALWQQAPQRVRSLALCDTRANADTVEGRKLREAAMQSVVANGRRWLGEQMLPKLLSAQASTLVRARLQTMIEQTPVESIVADLQGMRERPDRRALLPGITVPTLVLVGEQDVLTPPSDAQAMAAAIPNAKLVQVPGAGHLVPMEAPAEFAAALDAFLT